MGLEKTAYVIAGGFLVIMAFHWVTILYTRWAYKTHHLRSVLMLWPLIIAVILCVTAFGFEAYFYGSARVLKLGLFGLPIADLWAWEWVWVIRVSVAIAILFFLIPYWRVWYDMTWNEIAARSAMTLGVFAVVFVAIVIVLY